MTKEIKTLSIIQALPEPRHLFILPGWADPVVLDGLIRDGFLTCQHLQRDENGVLNVMMGLQLTPKGERLIHPLVDFKQLALKGSLAGASFMVMSLLILYLG